MTGAAIAASVRRDRSIVGLLALAAAWARPGSAVAQDLTERVSTQRFTIEYAPPGGASLEFYAAHADSILDSTAAALGVAVDDALTLRLYPTTEAFLEAQPIAYETRGVLVHGIRGRDEVDVALDRAEPSGASGLESALRHGLGHVLVSRLTGGRLPELVVEGTAELFERPGPDVAVGVARLRDAWSTGPLASWHDLGAAGAAYLDPATTYPQALSIAHYLVERRGWETYRSFLAEVGGRSWMVALEGSYGSDAKALEADWRAWLPGYLSGGWQRHPLYAADLDGLERAVKAGDYSQAAARLGAAALFSGEGDPVVANRISALLDRARTGASAEADLDAALKALEDGEYSAASAAALEAGAGFRRLEDAANTAVADEVARRADQGAHALRSLSRARAAPWWRAVAARIDSQRAAAAFGALGDSVHAGEARDIARRVNRGLVPLGLALLTSGIGLLALSGSRRLRAQGLRM